MFVLVFLLSENLGLGKKWGVENKLDIIFMKTVAEILSALTFAEKYKVMRLWSYQSPLDERIKFIKGILIGRLNWTINGWEIMEYNLIFQVICNKITKELNIMV